MAKKKIKTMGKIQKPCTNCFQPTYLKFNFSFITYSKNLSLENKAVLFDRMLFLSKQPFVVVNNYNKKLGLEYIKKNQLKISKEIACTFEDDKSYRKTTSKYSIFRLYPNNNPIVARVIGEIIKNIFYVFYIDIGGELYKH